ncbi:HlyD family efflux transporter periplasmic adaptor subunit [Demequina salsinemoris]|uniref:HlyD family efflux transporter periplasmic adaptor subunit n=1 Tax=Demequina salsinemoris TaxID=577470 RepID=UPI000780FB25|nr:HlyD family efflux transporter periplasmic adaptor subunit [Demequina salsinemoris]
MLLTNQVRFALGLAVVLLIGALSTVVFNQREHRLDSVTGSIQAVEHPVGTDYAGIVTTTYVAQGDEVSVGDPLMQISSTTLERDVAEGLVDVEDGLVSAEGDLTIVASVDGIVTDIAVNAGSYAWQGSPVATISEEDTLYVTSDFQVNRLDFDRIPAVESVDITLPDDTIITGTLEDFTVEQAGDYSTVTGIISSNDLDWGSVNGLVAPGTPVLSTLNLEDSSILAGVGDMLQQFVHRIGL